MKTTAAFQCCLAVLAGLFFTISARAQSDDFNDGNDTGWTRYAPLQPLGAAASFTLTGGTYRITCDPSPNAASYGPSRAGSLRQEVKYTTFFVSVELKDWNPAEDTSMGILARVQPGPGIGATDGYAFTYQGKDGDVQLSRITDEKPTSLGRLGASLQLGQDYRMTFFGVGPWLEGRIYAGTDPSPLVTVSATDATYAEGTCGLVVFADENTRASAAFDNYLATNGATPPPELKVADEQLKVTWDKATGLGHALEFSLDLQNWDAVPAHGVEGGRILYIQEGDPLEVPMVFYRLRLGPAPVGAIE